jgi:transcriptional regulator of acetoin/glycerol metabolism
VRELQNVLERLMVMSGDRITTLDLPEEILAGPAHAGAAPSSCALKEFRDRAERDHIIATLRRHNGNVSQAAIELGVGRTYLHKRLAVLQIAKKDFLV